MFECPRCDYFTKYKSSMKNHLKRKNVCEFLIENISIEKCKKMFQEGNLYIKDNICNEKIKYKCICGKSFDRNTRLLRHKSKCEMYKGEQYKIEELEEKIKTLYLYNEEKHIKIRETTQVKIKELEEKIIILQQPKIPQQKSDLQFVYILQEREFINSGEPVYKIGKTINPKNRMSSYPKASNVLGIYLCGDCHTTEKSLIELFDVKFIKRKDLGLEYYQGDINEMVNEIYFLILNKS
jgi:hypothetical protein